MDCESEKRNSPFLDQTILRAGGKQDQLPTQTDEVTTPLTQFTQNIMGTSVVTVKPKAKSTQTKMSTQQMPIQPDFYLPNGKGSRLSEVHQIKTTEKSPEGTSCSPNNTRKFKVYDTIRGMSRLLGNAMSALVFALA